MAYITADDLENALGPQRFLALFDDTGTAVPNANAVALVIQRAHARVVGTIRPLYQGQLPPDVDQDPLTQDPVPWLLRDAELELAMIFAYDRQPGLVRGQGELTVKDRQERYDAFMEAIRSAAVQVTDNAPAEPLETTGGVAYDMGLRTMLGTSRGDF